ncbi:TPA: PfkB family carbohydrate kinase [Providencia stuartii]|uniref:PfkB family carbohydrate kinase n=1 Tax=Providencia TaxID=586 RepID=UPI000CE6766D|nr:MULTISPECIES: PfkB family carbohydrate kinase [Providencia]AVE41698.1 ribokinase [Providencia stuartii]MBN5557811.1 ribokinase [Providencia stuartii]NMT48655.1 ribokinase [Providencia stuartii]HEM7146354.1 ribokinase [Providencia stuartii]HEM8264252.1 ribokinase [Providencia stuartii]
MRTVAVIGAAAGDCVLSVARMPRSGEDIAAHDHGWQIGGCAFNVLRALARLQLPIINGIRVGNGQWGQRVRQALSELGVSPFFVSETQDNGWCFALTEPNGERTFISIAGCEEEWNREELQTLALPNDSIIYASGYELGCLQGEALQQWLLNDCPTQTLVLDLGPRLAVLPQNFLQQLPANRTLLTVNRDEARFLCGEGDLVRLSAEYAYRRGITLIVRLDSQGAWLCQPNQQPLFVPAYQVAVVDTIGAGDAHTAGVLAGLSQGWSLRDCVDFGNQVAAIVVSKQGPAGAPTLSEINQSALSQAIPETFE